jgi:sigma-E factor negative regulatory protein RseA
MTDQINDQISAFIDNELPDDESALLVRRFERDSEARARAMRYTLIGSALRGELLEPHPSVLRQRLAAALSGATPGVARGKQSQSLRFGAPLLRIGIAAAVAVVAIGTLRWVSDGVELPRSAGSPPVDTPLVVREVPELYVVPETTDQARTVVPITLTTYLMHHSEYASQLARTSVSSNVVGAATELVDPDPAPVVSKPVPLEQPVALSPAEQQ